MTTKQFAYEALANLLKNGTALERHIASLSLELLGEDQKEHEFVSGLQQMYENVAEKNSNDVMLNRKVCAELTMKV